jgi:glycosyltransferase involved in cell wall biosynthesis
LIVAIASCWPPSVAEGSGTTVSQNRLVEALRLAGIDSELLYTSRFGRNAAEVEARREANAGLKFDAYDVVLGIDGEGWLWAEHRTVPYIALCEAVLTEIVPFEQGQAVQTISQQAEWEGAAARLADAVIARSEFSAGRVADAYGVPRERITVVPVPFDIAVWAAALPREGKEPLVLAVGHAYPRKNYAALLQAWPAVLTARPDARLVVVGDGPETPRLAALAASLPSVELRGHLPLPELLALYARAQVFCHPSLQENFGIAVIEGLACGAALVAHNQPAIVESAGGLPGVWIVDATQPADLANALVEALKGPRGWQPDRLEVLARRVDPRIVSAQLAGLLASVSRVG